MDQPAFSIAAFQANAFQVGGAESTARSGWYRLMLSQLQEESLKDDPVPPKSISTVKLKKRSIKPTRSKPKLRTIPQVEEIPEGPVEEPYRIPENKAEYFDINPFMSGIQDFIRGLGRGYTKIEYMREKEVQEESLEEDDDEEALLLLL